MAQTKFTQRLQEAVASLQRDASMKAIECRSLSLFSPVFRNRKYRWITVMHADGLLVSRRSVYGGGSGKKGKNVALVHGMVIQSEDTTSQTKPNPIGKASLAHIPNGIWVDLIDAGRVRLELIRVLFVLPKGTAPKHQRLFQTARQNVENAADMMPEATVVSISRGASALSIAKQVKKWARPFLVGVGRPTADR